MKRHSIARRSALLMSLLSFFGVGMICIFSYQAIAMYQEMRHLATLDRAAIAIEQVLSRQPELQPTDMWNRVDELLLTLGNVRAKIHGPQGQLLYGPPVLHGHAKERVTTMRSLASYSGTMPMRHLELALDVSEERRFLGFIAMFFAVVTVAWGFAVMLLSGTLARFELKPLHAFGRRIAALDPSSLTARIHTESEPEELFPVIEQFNRLMGKVVQYHEQLRSFNSNVAHELNTPLSSLTVSHELLLREKLANPITLQDALHCHLEELQRMNRIIQSMLFLSQTTQGDQSDFTHIPSLAALAGKVTDYMEATAEERDLRLEIQGDAHAKADQELIKRALSNLLSNAVRYAEAGSTVIVSIALCAASTGVRFTVSNQGPAVPADSLPRLFDPFYRVDSARVQSHQNHGLGLAIVAAVARLHGGEPFVNNSPGWVHVGFTLGTERTLK
ncbi:MAG TPA: ATP-binding protein [Limnobacter sp.]|nr:ATP-binding protein [Limnobacter sp.]